MSDFTGQVQKVYQDYETGKYNVVLTINEGVTVINDLINHLTNRTKLRVSIKKWREKRSLDSNAYAWCLIQEIAEAIHSDKWSVYLLCLQKYSRAFTHVIVKPDAIEKMKELYRTCVDLGEITVNGQTGHQLQVYYGSSTFDSKEMSVFIDGIVSECKELGIETLPPKELERLNATWNDGK